MWATRLSVVEFQDSDFVGGVEDSKSTSGGVLYICGSRTFLCPHQLDVEETNVSIPQFNRVRNHFVGYWIANGWTICSRPLGCGNWSVAFIEQYQITESQGRRRELSARSRKWPHIQTQAKGKPRQWSIVAGGPRYHKRTLFSWWVSVVHFFEDNEAVIKMMRTKSNNETRVQNSQSCAWFVVRQHWTGTEDPNQLCWHQKPTCWHSNQSEFHARRVEPSSSSVQHHWILNVFLQPFQ